MSDQGAGGYREGGHGEDVPAPDTISMGSMPAPPEGSSSHGGRRAWVLGLAGVAVIASAGAGFAAGSVIGGGGTQPEDVLPSTVVAYADLDLDPPAGQKLNVVRLLGRFPDVENEYGAEPDLRQVLTEKLTEGTDLADADVDEWVGDRAGVGLAWDDDANALTPVAAIQVTDEDAAVSDLQKALGESQVAAVDGYVVLTPGADHWVDDLSLAGSTSLPVSTQTADEIVSAGEAAPLSESAAFSGAFDRLDDGLASFYVDGEGMASVVEHASSVLDLDEATMADPFGNLVESGQTAAVLRAESDALELDGWSTATPASGGEPATMISALPGSTLFALEFTGGADSVGEQWDKAKESLQQDLPRKELERSLAQLEAQFGVKLPEDLQTLFGDDLVIAVDGDGLLTGVPGIGARSVTDPADAADLADRLQRTLAEWSGGFGITAQGTDDGMVIASSPEFADQLTAGDGDLGQTAGFQSALPDAEGASYLVWLDFSAVSTALALAEPDAADVIEPLDSFGFTMTPGDDGTSLRARLVFSDEGS